MPSDLKTDEKYDKMLRSPETRLKKLCHDGPHKSESTPRRVRGLLNGIYIFDTTSAIYVWEHPYYPYFYIPGKDFASDYLGDTMRLPSQPDDFYACEYVKLRLATRKPLQNRSPHAARRVENSAWTDLSMSNLQVSFVEDQQIHSHPKDPYKRIECITSSRTITICTKSSTSNTPITIASSSSNIFLYETLLRPRYYLSPTSINHSFLIPSETTTFCPYQGMANYYHINIDGNEIEDAVWYYQYPTNECAEVAGRLCFYNEKVDVYVDGVKEE